MPARTEKPKPKPKSKSKSKSPAQSSATRKRPLPRKASGAASARPSKAVAKPRANAPRAAAKKVSRAGKASPAREARKAHAMKKVIAEVIAPAESGSTVVDAYMRDIDHPFKAEMEAVRAVILGASPKLSERIKWNAPSFYYKEDLATFNPGSSEYAHLILLFPGGTGMPLKSALLEGKHKDRREAKFYSVSDVEAKRGALQKLIKNWVKLRDA